MKIAFNPSTVAALTTPPNNKDITFDLRGHNIFARGVKFLGTDTNTWRDIKINNVSIGSYTLDLRNGSNTTLTNTNGVVTINSTWRPVVDNLTSDSTTSSLSANLGRVLAGLINGKSDSDHNHDDRYVKKTGDTMFGALNFANGTWNLVGDDSYMGDCNVSGHFGIKAANTTYPGISFFNNANDHLGNLTAYSGNIKYGAYSLQFLDNGNTSVGASTWTNPFSNYNSNAVADGQAICVWGLSSYLGSLANDTGDMSLWLKRVNANIVTLNMVLDGEYYANGNLRLAHVSEIPNSLKNPHALTISLNGASQGPYDGSAAKNINITPGSIGAATSDHNHDGRYVYNYGGTADVNGLALNQNALFMSTTSGITGDWWHILQAAWNDEYCWNSLIAFPTLNRNGMYYRSGLGDNTAWGSWVKLLDTNNYSSTLDARYYTESEVDNLLSKKLNISNFNWTSLPGKIIAGNEFNIVNAGYDQTIWFNYLPLNDRSKTAFIHTYIMGNGARGMTSVTASGFVKNGSSSSYVLLGDGGHQTISSLSVNYASSAGNADTVDGYHTSSLFRDLGWWAESETHDANDITGNGAVFAYRNHSNVPTWGVLVTFRGGHDGYRWQMAKSYANRTLYIRQRNGDNGIWSNWLRLLDESDLTWDNIAGKPSSYTPSAHTHSWDSITGKPTSFTPSAHNHSWDSITDKIVGGNEFNIVNAGFNGEIWFNYLPINDRDRSATINAYCFGNGNRGFTAVTASGFIKSNSNNNYVLLGGGGHKLESALSVANADTVDGYHANASQAPYGRIPTIAGDGVMEIGKYIDFHNDNSGTYDFSTRLQTVGNIRNIVNLPSDDGTLALISDNVASATKLQTPRTIWGQSFDGTGDIPISAAAKMPFVLFKRFDNDENAGYVGCSSSSNNNIYIESYINSNIILGLSNSNVGIGTNSPAYKLDVNGLVKASGFHHGSVNSDNYMLLAGGGYKSFGGSYDNPIFLGYLNLDHGNDGTISSSFYCLGYSVPFTYTRGGNYCRISIPDTTRLSFYIKAAIASVNYSGGGMDTWVGDHRSAGTWWLHCYALSANEVRVKGFRPANSNNDSWWGGNPLYSNNDGANRITVCIFGYVTFR